MTVQFTDTAAYAAVALAPLDGLEAAACVRADPRLFTADRVTARQLAAAQLWCATCPVVALCYEGGVARRESGVWGGRVLRDGRDVTATVVEAVA